MASTQNAETISKINEVFEKWGVSDQQQTYYLKQALVCLCTKALAHFAESDGGHHIIGPKKALIGLKILTPWKF